MHCEEHRAAVLNEICLIVLEAIRDGDPVRADFLAKVVAASYRQSGFSAPEIARRIRVAAAVGGVEVEPGIVAAAASSEMMQARAA